jgi:hypothetical protein
MRDSDIILKESSVKNDETNVNIFRCGHKTRESYPTL